MDNSKKQDLNIEQKFRFETYKLLTQLGRASFLVTLITSSLAYYVLKDFTQELLLNIWISVLFITIVGRVLMIRLFWKLDRKGQSYATWVAGYLFFVYCAALCWGLLPLFNAFEATEWTEAFIIFVIAGMSSGGLVLLFPIFSAAIPYFLLLLLPLISVLATNTDPIPQVMSIFAILYLYVLIRAAYYLNSAIKKSINLEIENENLFEFLSAVENTNESVLPKRVHESIVKGDGEIKK